MVLTSDARANSIVMFPSRAPYRTRSPDGLNHASVPSGHSRLHACVTAPSRASMADVLPTPFTPASKVNEWSSGRSSLAMPLKSRTFSDRTCGYGGMTVVPGILPIPRRYCQAHPPDRGPALAWEKHRAASVYWENVSLRGREVGRRCTGVAPCGANPLSSLVPRPVAFCIGEAQPATRSRR